MAHVSYQASNNLHSKQLFMLPLWCIITSTRDNKGGGPVVHNSCDSTAAMSRHRILHVTGRRILHFMASAIACNTLSHKRKKTGMLPGR